MHLDWETRSTVDLRTAGLHNYARSADTDIWCAAYSFGDEEPALWLPGQPCPPRIVKHVVNGGQIHAWNAPFEMEMWQEIAGPRYGWPQPRAEQFFCSMAACYAMGLPGALEDAALALGLHVLKDTEGRNLMLRMARPRSTNPTVWWDDADKLQRLYEYCRQDVRVERELHKRLMPLSAVERRVWLLDYKINQRGVAIDVPSVKAAVEMSEQVKAQANARLAQLTGGAVQAVTAVAALKDWIKAQGVDVDGLAKADVVDLLASDNLPEPVRKALILRQELGKASAAKLDAMLSRVGADGRLRQMYQYHGAATGRWAGRAVQTHNLPRDMPKAEAVEKILALVREGNHDAIDAIYGPPLTMISKCLRSFFVAPPGHMLDSGDFSNVEGRGQAWFAGEEWKLDAFRKADAKQGPGLYELAYARMFGVPVESVKNPSEERQIGKVAELAFGYQGGIGSFHTMGKNYNVRVDDTRAASFRDAWRAAHPKIKAAWYAIEKAAIAAVKAPGCAFECGHPGRQARYKMVGSFLWCQLPSGRVICYCYPRLLLDDYGYKLTYMTVPSPEDRKKGKVIDDPKNAPNWARIGTYGGSLFNNIIQGMSRDLLSDLMLRLDDAGAQIVLHTHDDCNIEVVTPKAEGARLAMQAMMRTPPAWAAGFPLHADCSTMARYGK